ncbi:MAG: hypothetical protein Q6L58_04385 [Thermostichales cyanobacterium BF3_bins_165]
MRQSRRPWEQQSENFNPWLSYTDLISGSLLIFSLVAFLLLVYTVLKHKDQNQINHINHNKDQKQINHNDVPPIIVIPDNEAFRFPTGSANLSRPLQQYIREGLVQSILFNRYRYNVDTIEIIGHTDGQPNRENNSNLDLMLEESVAVNALDRLIPGSNVDLGLMRALAIINELRKLQAENPELRGLNFRAYSAGQLYLHDGTFSSPNRKSDSSRRRIEVRFTRTGAIQLVE